MTYVLYYDASVASQWLSFMDIGNNNMFGLSATIKSSSNWISFMTGALSASLVWILIYLKYELLPVDIDAVEDSDDDTNGIGSKQRNMMRWPWDRIRDKIINTSASLQNIPNHFDCNSDTSSKSKRKAGPCIGEIFGLDVGGTLTKLVYFEEQVQEFKRTESESHRREQYHAAASAMEVLQARRSRTLMGRIHGSDSEADLKELLDMRIESVPDSLDEFASSCNISINNMRASVSLKKLDLANEHRKIETDSCSEQINQDVNKKDGGSSERPIKKSMSMVNISKTNEHAEVLDNFYSFARRLDSYETAVKEKHLSYYSRSLNGQFHFIRFETRHMKNAMNLMRINDFHQNIKEIGATGGGAHKYANEWDRELGIKIKKQDEMDSLVAGMQFVLSDIVGECYTFKPNAWTIDSEARHDVDTAINKLVDVSSSRAVYSENCIPLSNSSGESSSEADNSSACHRSISADFSKIEERNPRVDQWWTSKKIQRDNEMSSSSYPYLLVSIGTGVSILRVDGPRQHERVSGSTIGGGTYWGLCRLLTGSDSFSDVLNLAMKGDPSKVDMMVGDIYGKNSGVLEKIGLTSDVVASSFGKLVTKRNPSLGVKEEDLARALLLMVTNNIGQVAHLNAQLHKTSRIYFIGTFLQHNIISQQRLAYAIDFWSRGKMEALFLEHEGYFGALGSFLLNHGIQHNARQPLKVTAKVGSIERKRHPTGIKLHHRSKSMGSIHPL